MSHFNHLEDYETDVNLIAEGTIIDGNFEVTANTRFNGELKGKFRSKEGALLVIGQSGHITAGIEGDVVHINGFVKGDVFAKTKCVIHATATILGDIHAGTIQISYGAKVEGKLLTLNQETTLPPTKEKELQL